MPLSMNDTDTCAWYALRRTLPPQRFEENLDELLHCVGRYRIDEVIVKVDAEEFSHGQPPLDWVRRYQPRLHQVRDALAERGVVFSLNPWVTVGHNDRGRNSRVHLPGLGTMVGHDGRECRTCACPLDPVWRHHVDAVWRLYAECHPTVIWIEDDIRTFNHRPVRFGCFCSAHMARFSQRIGVTVTRDELVTAILQPGAPHPWRAHYLAVHSEVIVETATFLRDCVHAVDPTIAMGLMSSGPRNHCMEGRDWSKLATALTDNTPVYSRPPMGNYHETSLRGLYYSHDAIKATRHCMPVQTLEQTEVENFPYSRYANSITFTFLEMAVSFAYGSHGVTMNLFDHCGTPMAAEPAIGQMLAAKKPFFEALASRMQTSGQYQGVRLLHDERSGYTRQLVSDAELHHLIDDGSAIMEALESHGIPTTYDASSVVAATGQTIRGCSDSEIRQILRNGVVLDGVAAAILIERGFANDIGAHHIEAPRCIDELGAFSAEEFHNVQFGGGDGKYLTVTVPNLAGRPNICCAKLVDSAVIISQLVDPDAQRRDVFMYAFENSHGGRVAVMCYDIEHAFGISWCHPFRRQQLHGVMRWLSRDTLPITVADGPYPLAMRKDCGNRTIVGVFNLTLDVWPSVSVTLADTRLPERAELLSPDGEWSASDVVTISTDSNRIVVTVDDDVTHSQPVFLTVYWTNGRA